MRIAIISFTGQGGVTGERLDNGFKDLGYESRAFSVHGLGRSLSEFVKMAFAEEDGLVFIGAAGIAVRSIAPFLKGKDRDPAVVVVDELGRFAVSLLSGHLGGANELASEAAQVLGAQPVITTATDLHHAFAVDLFAKKNGLEIDDLKEAKKISAAVLRGEPVGFFSDFPVEGEIPEPLDQGMRRRRNIYITCTSFALPFDDGDITHGCGLLRLIPRAAVLGMGCRRNIPEEAAKNAAEELLRSCGIDRRALVMLASIDLKREEKALIALAADWGLSWKVFTSEELGAVEGSSSESQFVKSVTGVGNVCERSALAGAAIGGGKARLAAGKRIFPSVTAAAAIREISVKF